MKDALNWRRYWTLAAGGKEMNAGIIGTGTVGASIAIKLHAKGYQIKGIAGRDRPKTEELAKLVGSRATGIGDLIMNCQVVFIATPDRVIQALVDEFAEYFHAGQTVIHFSGALRSDIMESARQRGAQLLSIHPLQSFANVKLALETLEGTHFSIEGDNQELGEKIVRDLGGIPHLIDGHSKALYHAGAVFASNYLVTLADVAVNLLEKAGFERKAALDSLMPLMKGTLANLERVGLTGALTGPIARGDVATVRAHLEILPQEVLAGYSALGLQAANIARAKGTLGEDRQAELLGMLHKAAEHK
ncbi:MAG TPA: DUF2520 domain-containing protein [Verrucomicrobiae bacterium]|nr:DUF2520 domain-containing protein [Verrucomicrobiae bacterium]